ncbi:MAG: hypothetical protein M3P98_02945 [bacterium]|nr:hypothetical protein [bacterium]MDQ3159063.1 hypothetical protein [bacterium]
MILRNTIELLRSFSDLEPNLGERLGKLEEKKQVAQAMHLAHALGAVANCDLRYDRPEASDTVQGFKEVLHANDIALVSWPAGWQALQSYFGE